MLKRTFDFAVSFVGLMITLPAFLAIAAAIKLSSPGPVFYRGLRVGLNGRRFRMFKFRTMIVGADTIGGPSTASTDPRITPVGRFLRRHKLDELPQFINVFLGEMSLVGPRPEVPQYVALYTDSEREILSVRPGITDWATLWNPDEGAVLALATDAKRAYLEVIRPQKIRWQLEYVRRRTFWVDLRILLSTARVVVLRRPAKAFEAMRGTPKAKELT